MIEIKVLNLKFEFRGLINLKLVYLSLMLKKCFKNKF